MRRETFGIYVHILIQYSSSRTKLSKSLPTQVSKVELRPAADLKEKYGVDLRTGVVS